MQLDPDLVATFLDTRYRVIGRRSSACARCRCDSTGLATAFAHRCRSISGHSDVDRKDANAVPGLHYLMRMCMAI
jgi:hypothetical protein